MFSQGQWPYQDNNYLSILLVQLPTYFSPRIGSTGLAIWTTILDGTVNLIYWNLDRRLRLLDMQYTGKERGGGSPSGLAWHFSLQIISTT